MIRTIHDFTGYIPEGLKPGDLIAIVSPSGSVKEKQVHEAAEILNAHGWNVRIYPHALGEFGTYSGSSYQRYDDLSKALMDPEVRAVICSRGGYGAVHLLQQLEELPLQNDPKWIVGFSDISAIHALLAKKGIVSVHGPMTKDITKGAEDPDITMLFNLLEGNFPETTFPPSVYDRPGLATGILLGGNLSVIAQLIGTPFNMVKPDTILFIEDVEEPIYKIERVLYQMRLAGVLERLKGLIVGQFTGYKKNDNYNTMEEMIYDMVAPYSYPVAMNVPFGHVDHNIPLLSGAYITLRVTSGENNSIVYW